VGLSYWESLKDEESAILRGFLKDTFPRKDFRVVSNGPRWTAFASEGDRPRSDMGDFIVSYIQLTETCLFRLYGQVDVDGSPIFIYNSPDYWRFNGN
jgi:hypothetical protein